MPTLVQGICVINYEFDQIWIPLGGQNIINDVDDIIFLFDIWFDD